MTTKQKQVHLNPAQLTKIIEQLSEENQAQKQELTLLKEQVSLLLAQLFGKKSEKKVPDSTGQMSYLDLPDVEIELPPEFIEVPAHDRKKKGRQALPAHLPRTEVIHDISEEEKQCACGAELSRIGEEHSEQLVHVPAKLEVNRHIRYKYVCKSCEGLETKGSTVKIAPLPKVILPKSIASASLLTSICIAKFVDAFLSIVRKNALPEWASVPIYQEPIWRTGRLNWGFSLKGCSFC
ncbi:MAG: hypothetical protein GY786_11385 [Proteobacteria bacterium]|nr:hypothetical protein [Pseudomonadota bacterium]